MKANQMTLSAAFSQEEQLHRLLYCGAWGLRGAGCGLQLLSAPPFASSSPADVTVTGFVRTPRRSISKCSAQSPSLSLSPSLITPSSLCLDLPALTCSRVDDPH